MSTTAIIEEPKFEILPPDVSTASTELSCPADKVAALYQPSAKPFEAAADLLAAEESATTAFDARALRLKMVKARTTITATKDESKSDIKLAANIIDWFHAKGRDRLAAAEARLLEIEKAEERAEAARLEAIREERAETLDSMGHVSHGINLGSMTDDAWIVYLAQAKDVYEMREIRAKREAEEAAAELAKREAEAEAQRLEAIRVKAEHKAIAEALEAERKERAAEAKRKDAELEAAHEAGRKAREEAEAIAKAEREKSEAAAAAERDARRQEFLAAEKAAEIARQKANAELLKEREAKAKIEAEAKALRDAEAKRIADQKAAEVAKAKADAAAAKKAAAAPDKAKLMHFADMVRHLEVPLANSEAGKEVAAEIGAKCESFANWIETQASTL